MDKIRLRLATILVWLGSLVAPKPMGPVFLAYCRMLDKFPEEISMGRKWGVVSAPWSLHRRHEGTAHAMQQAAMMALRDWREEFGDDMTAEDERDGTLP